MSDLNFRAREIKFRMWLSGPERMVEWPEFRKKYATRWLNDEALPVMQYTGLKDKNGKEIYEGDIMLQPANAPENEDSYMVVKFGDMGDDRQGFWLDGCTSGSFIGVFESNEVIGNIYENAELLK